MTTVAVAERRADVLAALRRLRGRGTAGDVAAAAGLPLEDVRQSLKALLETHRGQLAVSDSGELIYEFDRRLIERGTEPFLARAKRKIAKILRGAFKAWIVVMLVGYFLLFVVLVIAALLASQRGDDSRGGGWGGRGRRGGHLPIPDLLFWYWIWSPRWPVGRPYYGHRWERTLDREDRVPFYKKVFAFVFGPDRPQPTRRQIDRERIRLIRAKNGVLTTAELVEHTGLPFTEAEQEMARLLGAYDGEALVAPAGELVYAFPELMTSVREERRVRAPEPAWLRLERPLELTGNTAAANAAVAAMNGFTLVAAATSPWFIFPRLGIGGDAAWIGLVVVPVVFSTLFYAIPAVRTLAVHRENRRRHARNVRRVLLGLVYRRALESEAGTVDVAEAHRWVASRLGERRVAPREVEKALHELAAELDADVEPDESGALRFAFPAVRRQLAAGEAVRRKLELERKSLGEIVYSTADTAAQADARDAALFDRALSGAELDPARYVPALDRVDFEEDFALVTFDEELRRHRLAGSVRR
ncbi:MAG TPA: hypothetical protein VFQ22_06890 [Longimicrobiales bacterium]|nr:hypothetical protein [Longimicrobiales bacterium]